MTIRKYETPQILQVSMHQTDTATVQLQVVQQSIWVRIGAWPTELTLFFDSLEGIQEIASQMFNQAEDLLIAKRKADEETQADLSEQPIEDAAVPEESGA